MKGQVVQINDKTHLTYVFLVMLTIMISALFVAISNTAFAQILNDSTLENVLHQISGSDRNSQIDVGKKPQTMAVNHRTNTIYVVNAISQDVSVIDGQTHTKKVQDIPVGDGPTAIAVNELTNTIYVVNRYSDNVSVIDGQTHTKKVQDIPVGDGPTAIAVNELIDRIYVTNFDSDTVSVINENGNIKNISDGVGDGPTAIDVYLDKDKKYNKVYVVNSVTDSVSIINEEAKDVLGPNIHVGQGGEDPDRDIPHRDIVIDYDSGKIYVTNYNSGDIYVIDGTYNNASKPIHVGGSPTAMVVDEKRKRLYVTNFDDDNGPRDGVPDSASDNVTVIDYNEMAKKNVANITEENIRNIAKGIRNITVWDGPIDIDIYHDPKPDLDEVYVANSRYSRVSIIDASETDPNPEYYISVGEEPRDISISPLTNTIYVVNARSDGVSVINGADNKVVAQIAFQVNPFNSGYIQCDKLPDASPLGQFFVVSSGTECTAKENPGFDFVSWQENLEDNSTQLITFPRPAPILDSIANLMDPDPIAERWDSLLESVGMQPISQSLGLNPYDSKASTFKVTKFGTFTANFKELPSAVPTEFWLQTYGLVLTVIAGLSIPSIIAWARSWRNGRKLNDYYLKQIASLHEHGSKLGQKDALKPLNRLRNDILDACSKRKINEKHWESLSNEISILYEKIIRKRIDDALNNKSAIKKPKQDQLDQIRNEIELAYSEGKIIEKHYDLLTKAISNLDNKGRDTS